MLDPSFDNVSMRRGSHRRFERLAKVMRAQPCYRGEFDQAEFVGQMRVDVIEHASHLPGRKPASVRDRRTLRRAVNAQQMNSQHGGKPLHIKASAGTALIQLAPSERAEPPDLRVLDPNRGVDREFTCSVEVFLPDFRDEGYIEPEREEGRRCAIADPKWHAGVADMSLAMRDGARSYAVALSFPPVHVKGFAVM